MSFTGNQCALGEFEGRFGLRVERDCSFAFLGKISTRLVPRVVACTKATHISEAVDEDGVVGIICIHELASLVPKEMGLAVAKEPQLSLFCIHEELCQRDDFFWKSFDSQIHQSAKVHPTAVIAERDVVIGKECVIGAYSIVHERSVLGDHCRIGPHCSIGSEGFEVGGKSEWPRVMKHAGGVRLGTNVELQSHCVVACSSFGGFTEVGSHSKLDCFIVVTHDASLGENVKIAGGVTVCGRAEIGHGVFLAPQSVVSNGVKIGDNAWVSIGAVVVRDVGEGEKVSGNFALPHRQWMGLMKGVRE